MSRYRFSLCWGPNFLKACGRSFHSSRPPKLVHEDSLRPARALWNSWHDAPILRAWPWSLLDQEDRGKCRRYLDKGEAAWLKTRMLTTSGESLPWPEAPGLQC